MWLSNLKIVLPEGILASGSLALEDGLIAAVREGAVPGGVDCRGLTAIAGLVDMHGDMLERELQPRPGSRFPFEPALYELDKQLASNGITTAYAAISFIEGWQYRGPEEGLEMVRQLHRFRRRCLVEMRVHARFEVTTPSAAPILREALAKDEIHLVSLMDHSPGQGQFRDLEKYVTYYSQWIGAGATEHSRIRARALALQEAPSAWPIAREVCELAQERGLPLASHDDDTRDKVDLMVGLGTSISEFPVTLEPGLRADLALVEEGACVRVRATFRAGRLIYSDGSLVAC